MTLASPVAASAQQDQGKLRDDDVYDHGHANFIKHPGCVIEMAAPGIESPDCWGNPNEENRNRLSAHNLNRWVQGGILLGVELWQGYRYVRGIYNDFKSMYERIEAIVKGARIDNARRTVLRLKYAVDRFDRRLDQHAYVDLSITPNPIGGRYDMINDVIAHALASAQEGEEFALGLSDQSAAMSVRLYGEDAEIQTLGGEAQTSTAALPPIAADAPAAVASNTGPALVAAGARADIRPGGPILVGAAGPQAAPEASDWLQCVVPEAEDDPEVIYHRVAVQAFGAQTAAAAAGTDMMEQRELVRMILMREKQLEEERFVRSMVRMLTTF